MQALKLSQRFTQSFFFFVESASLRSLTSHAQPSCRRLISSWGLHGSAATFDCGSHASLLGSPWSLNQRRGVRVNAIQLRVGNVIEKTGRVFRVIDAEHKQQGRGGATMQVELRDVDNGNKVNLRFGTEETVERVFVEEKTYTCLYTENNTAYLIEPETFDQVEVPMELFGKGAVYLKEEMKVQLQLFDGRPLSGSVQKHVTCKIVETQPPMKGLTSAPRYKKAVLDNGSTIQVPSYLESGEEIMINTEEDSFVKRAK